MAFVCKVCGYVHEADELPDGFTCPMCGVDASNFEEQWILFFNLFFFKVKTYLTRTSLFLKLAVILPLYFSKIFSISLKSLETTS